MKPSEQRAARRQEIVQAAVAAFDASGREYACLAVVYDVVDPIIARMCAETPDLYIRERQCRNLAAETIHRRKHPK